MPVLVQACDDENDKVDLDSRRDAFCGKISVCNNLYQYGIPLLILRYILILFILICWQPILISSLRSAGW